MLPSPTDQTHEVPPVRHWIGAQYVGGGVILPSVDPATGATIGSFHDVEAEQVGAAIVAAKNAFETSSWPDSPMLRSQVLSHLADRFEDRREELVTSLCRENGKLQAEALRETSYIGRALRMAAGLAIHPRGRVADVAPGVQSMAIRQPIGVVGVITPWNSPSYLSVRSIAPALAAGCTVVVKMPAQAAQTAAIVMDLLASVPELPAGVVNILIETGSVAARRLVEAPDVKAISYTGSTATGRNIAQAAASQLKRVGLELGGKTPHLIFPDADLDAAIPVVVKSCTVFAGQFCMTGSRVLVHESIADEVRTRLVAALGAVRPGPAADPASDMGPLIDQAAVRRVNRMVDEAVEGGARVLLRGGPGVEEPGSAGSFYRPTLLEVDDSAVPIVQQEIFGPVQVLQVFATEDEAVALANDTEFGLSASIWTRDVDRPVRLSRRLEAGLISVNSWANLTVEFEEGGWKASGTGRLGGLAGLDDFLEYKQITQDFAGGRR
ncbi:aldehyde dehydrogenase family protein [Kineosporia mesophila]|uniref:Aldehyde dehydrogenase family protein n=1 Tax=Kineosporia mesophila TaxID=566012 RepID=A0ABP6ZTU8_9ACTN